MSVLYEESPLPGGRWPWLVPVAVMGVAVVAAITDLNDGLIMPAMILGVVFAVFLYSSRRYNAIRLDDTQLAVGRDALALSSIDPQLGAVSGTQALDAKTLDSLELGLGASRKAPTGNVHILGGSWGRPKTGSKWVAVRRADGGLELVATRHPDRFMSALNRALSAPGDRSR